MLTALRFMYDADSGWIVPVFLLVGAAIFCILWLLSWRNRTKSGIVKMLLCLTGSGLLCDIAWRLMFYPGGEYQNMGLGGTLMGLMFWPVSLLVLGMIAKSVK